MYTQQKTILTSFGEYDTTNKRFVVALLSLYIYIYIFLHVKTKYTVKYTVFKQSQCIFLIFHFESNYYTATIIIKKCISLSCLPTLPRKQELQCSFWNPLDSSAMKIYLLGVPWLSGHSMMMCWWVDLSSLHTSSIENVFHEKFCWRKPNFSSCITFQNQISMWAFSC